jgi:hypothetical protein
MYLIFLFQEVGSLLSFFGLLFLLLCRSVFSALLGGSLCRRTSERLETSLPLVFCNGGFERLWGVVAAAISEKSC